MGAPPGVEPAPAYAMQPAMLGYQAPSTNGLAIAAMICGILGFFMYGVPGIVGLILGIVAVKQIKQTGQAGRGMAITGIVLGAVSIGFVLMWLAFMLFVFGAF